VRGAKLPILPKTSLLIADPQVRYLGTLGGNVANGDPGNDMPAVMLSLGASYHVTGKGGERTIAARDFYQGRLFHGARAGRNPHRGAHSGATGPKTRSRMTI
jgi:carbon-monoxide dehydrogenase medium subunit